MTLPSPSALRKKLPLNTEDAASIATYRSLIKNLVTGQDPRLAIVVGPCSLHNRDSALEYAHRLSKLQSKIDKTCVLVMRAHVEKPRTCLGWKGLLYDPSLTGKDDIITGIFESRQLLLDLVHTNIALASEFLDPLTSCYFSDLISWGFIGARTSTSQVHRQLASSLPMPVGFKNPIEGSIESVIQGAIAAQHPHSFLQIDEMGVVGITGSLGNKGSHIVLRGSDSGPNYDPASINLAVNTSYQFRLENRILIDCSHGNSQKNHLNQKNVLSSILTQHEEGNSHILGVMIESHLEEGSQSFNSSSLNPSLSLTDPCLGWSETEELILLVNEKLSSSLCSCG
ncbi:MAG: 3-deoxy-7-phosphoheptulonate synthase [Chlamydiota bacterium]